MDDQEGVAAAAQKIGLTSAGKHHDVLVNTLFEEKVERHLQGPVFVFDYPASLCPLTKRKRDNPAVAERFELYVNGMELANAYTELNDPITQEATFRQQLAGLPQEAQDSLAAAIPFPRRLGQADEFASLALHMIDNPYLNGEVVRLDAALRMAPR